VTVNAVDAFDVTEIERLDDESDDVVVWLWTEGYLDGGTVINVG
jgi:hypothetical protein